MSLPSLLPIQPFSRPARGEAGVPGSKSLTNRAMLLAALATGPTNLTGALFSDDTRIMGEALRRLGFAVAEDSVRKEIAIEGQGGHIPLAEADLFVGLAGTAARFLTALCAAAPRGVYRLDGVEQMRKRPMAGLIAALRSQGAEIRCLGEEGRFPLEIHAHGLKGGTVTIDASESSQMLSALLLVAPLARAPLLIETAGTVRTPFVEMTRRLREAFVAARQGGKGSAFAIEPDATAASYFLALPAAATGSVFLPGLHAPKGGMLQGDSHFADVLNELGVIVRETDAAGTDCGGVGGSSLPGIGTGVGTHSGAAFGLKASHDGSRVLQGVQRDFSKFSDTFLTIAALSPLLASPTRISGIAHTRKQETDRVAGAALELRRLGQTVEETEDSLAITPQPEQLRRLSLGGPVEIDTYGDHRFAMSFAILGCHDLHGDGRPWIAIRDPACCAKTFPDFFEVLETLRLNSLDHP